MKYNDVIDVQETTVSNNEPVTLEEVKRHLNMMFDTSGAYDFNDDDTYLTEQIPVCREVIENYTGLSLVPKQLRAILRNECGGIEIPKGPVTSFVSAVDKNGNTVTPVILGNQFKWIESCGKYFDITYNAGYTSAPNQLKRAILEEIAFRYRNRGDQQKEYATATVSLCDSARELAAPYKRISSIV